jgi:hypothetical protein
MAASKTEQDLIKARQEREAKYGSMLDDHKRKK